MKQLYSFLVEYKVGDETKSKVIVLAKPTPRQIEDGEVEFAATVANYVRKGVFTRAMLFKKYEDLGGGVLPQSAEFRIAETRKEYINKTLDFSRLEAKKNPTADERIQKTRLAEDIDEIRKVLWDAETAKDSIYNSSADKLAHNKMIYWWLFELIYVRDEDDAEDKSPEKFITGGTYEDKKDKWYALLDEEPEFMAAASTKIMAFVQFLYYNQSTAEEDFKKFEQEFFPMILEEMAEEDAAAEAEKQAENPEPPTLPEAPENVVVEAEKPAKGRPKKVK